MCKYRLLQFAIVAQLLCLSMIVSRPVPTLQHTIPEEMLYPPTPLQRRYRLYNRCSGKHLQIPGRKISASSGRFAELLVSTVGLNSTIRIQGFKSKAYLCFTKKGKLRGRFDFVPELCVFEEAMDENMYTELWFRKNNKPWKVGFNKRGKALAGNSYNKHKDPICFQFLKRPLVEVKTIDNILENFVLQNFEHPNRKRKHRLRHKNSRNSSSLNRQKVINVL